MPGNAPSLRELVNCFHQFVIDRCVPGPYGVRDAALQVIPQDRFRHTTQGSLNAGKLLEDLHAGPLLLDHATHAADLAFNAAQTSHKVLLQLVRVDVETDFTSHESSFLGVLPTPIVTRRSRPSIVMTRCS